MRVKLLTILTFVAFLPFSPLTTALALSDVEVLSHLNQRLSAQIRLIDVSENDIEGLNINVSEIVDAITNSRHMNLSHELIAEGSSYYLRISSRDVVREPILSFQVELDWSTGHLLRNYALIIDPQ